MELPVILVSFIVAALSGIVIKRKIIIEVFSVIVSGVAFIGSISVAIKVAGLGTYAPFPVFFVDSLAAIIMLITSCIGLAVTMYSVSYLRQEERKGIIGLTRIRQFFILLHCFLAAMFLTVTASNPIITWIGIETTTLSTAFLISFYNRPSAMEAAWKYFIVNSVGLLLGFFGTLLYLTSVHAASENTFVTWNSLIVHAVNLDPLITKIAFIFVCVGYGVKVGLAPMHTWLPDAHSKAPAPISALLSGVLLNIAFFLVLRFKVITDASIGPAFAQNILIALGLLSVIIASFINFTQKNYKRLLAYSSIENMGIASIGFGLGGLGAFVATLHVIYHALIKAALFMLAGTIFIRYSSTKIAAVRGMLTTIPVTGVLFLLSFFIITGAPPFGMFFTKVGIFSAGMTAHPVISIVALCSAAILFISFFHIATSMFFGDKPDEIKIEKENGWLIIPPLALIAIVFYLSFYIPEFLRVLIDNVVA